MTKTDLHKCFVEKLSQQLQEMTEATRNAISDVTNPEHKARSKYETFSLESSYLARGQSLRVEELRDSLAKLRAMPLKPFAYTDPIQVGAVVIVMDEQGEEAVYFISTAEGGVEITTEDGPANLITPASPIGKALMGKRAGDLFQLGNSTNLKTFSILFVE
ncbi:GreA/GreB family elongation factor [Kiritimatiellota bacterium B12222]|nr:GreA/GreB family elongation factor [Kiritimatiellota bacterium B12222]